MIKPHFYIFYKFYPQKITNFMKVNIESLHFKADDGLVLFINEKIEKLKEHNNQIISSDVILRLGKRPENKIVEIKLNCDGCNFYAKKTSETFEKTTDMVIEALRRQLRKYKTKTIVKKRKIKGV